jgi:hypothetical protein
METVQLQKQRLQKLERNCFGTREWSKNSGICNKCRLKEDCGKINAKKEG